VQADRQRNLIAGFRFEEAAAPFGSRGFFYFSGA
jgi:hypothetical protein